MNKIADELKVTYEDLLALGESNKRVELFDGEPVMAAAMPKISHQLIAKNLGKALDAYVERNNRGLMLIHPVDVVLSQHNVVQPDLSYLTNDQLPLESDSELNQVPAMVVEILSPSTEERDRKIKFKEYARFGVKEYWLVSPNDHRIEVYARSDKGFLLFKSFSRDDELNTPLFPDIHLKVDSIFPQ